MAYKWRPSKTQAREFAKKMKEDEEFANAYYERKIAKQEKNRTSSKFDYDSAGGYYVPTESQYDFCMKNMHLFKTDDELSAMNKVICSYMNNMKTHHDDIHIVNEIMRNNIEL